MQISSEPPLRSRLLKTGEFVGGVLIFLPLFYILFDAATRPSSQLIANTQVSSLSLVVLPLSIAAATIVSGVSLFGYDWISSGSGTRESLIVGLVIATAFGSSVVITVLFIDVLAWGVENQNIPLLGIGAAGLLGLIWTTTRGVVAARVGYRTVE